VETAKTEFPGVAQMHGHELHRVDPTVPENVVDVSVPSQYNCDAKLSFDVNAKQLRRALYKTKCWRTCGKLSL
jgi:hypothetical protein